MNTIEISDYKTAERALCEKDLEQSLYDAGAVLMNKVLVTLHGEEHRARRTLEMRVFKRNFFRYYEHEVIPRILDEVLAPFVQVGRADVVDLGYRVMVYLTAAFAGVDRQDRSTEEFETLLGMLRTFGKAATLGQALGDPEPIKAEIRAALDEFDRRFFAPSVACRQALIANFEAGEISEDDLPRDVLTVLLRNEDQLDLVHDIMLRETAFFFLAGAHTSVHSLGHIMHHLMTWCEDHPEARQQLCDDMSLVQRFVHESFRLHPSSPVALRKALADVSFLSGEIAHPGDQVVIGLQTANRDTLVFGDDADEFNPYREVPVGIPSTGISFGVGIHACLGKNLAAGVTPKPGAQVDPETHQFGTLSLIAHALLRHGVRADPDNPPHMDETIKRETWAEYPVLLGDGE